MNYKEGSGEGEWIYIRDGSSLEEILRKELGFSVDISGHGMLVLPHHQQRPNR